MRSLLLLATSTAVAAFVGCSGSVTETTGPGGHGTGGHGNATASSSASSGGGAQSSASSSASSTGAGGFGGGGGGFGGSGGGDEHGTFATAQPVDIGVTLPENLANGTSDYFVFTGNKGQALDIEAVAQYLDPANPAPFDPSYIDTVVSLYDANQHKIAEDNDLTYDGNDADLFTVLPADGTYYIRVTECWTWSAESGQKCAPPQQKTHTQYDLVLYEKDPSQGNVVEDPVPDTGNTSATATPFKFDENADGTYKRTDVYGFFQGAADVDWFSFSVPADAPVNQGRLTEYMLFQLDGSSHDGSTEGVGTVSVLDAASMNVVAQVNGSTGQKIEVPVTAGTQYFVSVSRNDGLVGSNDFYAFFAFPGGSNVLEADDAGNDMRAGAEPMMAIASLNGSVGYFPGGDLTPAGTDVDWYVAAVPPNLPAGSMLYAACDGQYFGSGLIGLTATLVDANGNVLTSGTETANMWASTGEVPVPAGQQVYLEVSAASQDPTNTGTYYACGVYIFPP